MTAIKVEILILLLFCPMVSALEKAENIALSAQVTSDSEYSGNYLAKFAADGKVPGLKSNADLNQAWCVQGNTHRSSAQIRFTWPKEMEIRQVVYYGRTAWFESECFKDYDILADGEIVLSGSFKNIHGPQRVILPEKVMAKELNMVFTSSYNGPNPGASEIQIFPVDIDDRDFARFYDLTNSESKYLRQDLEIEGSRESLKLKDDLISGLLGFNSLVLIQRHVLNPSHVYTYHNEGFRAGGGLYILTPGNQEGRLVKIVDSPDGQILDCDLSYDGKTVLFSWKRSESRTYQLFKINIDGSGLTQLTDDKSHNFNACWLPDESIVFLSTRKSQYAYCWTSPVGILHRMDSMGRKIRRISANYLNDFTPSVMNDGSIIYGRWEYVDRPAIPIQSLWTIMPDGRSLSVFYGNRVLSPATFIEPRQIPGSTKVICTMTAHNGPCRGAIGIIDPSYGNNAQKAIVNLTPEVNIGKVDQGNGNHIKGPYESPYPLDDRYFLVSRDGTILLRDYLHSCQVTLLTPKEGMGFYGVKPVMQRKKPLIIPDLEEDSADQAWARMFLQDVYRGLEPDIERGRIKQICVVQEIAKPVLADVGKRAFGFQFPVVSCGATYAPKKIWGYADVDQDGSAYFEVPAGVPVYFMAIDKYGRALQRMRSFTHLAGGETQGCIGCHEHKTSSAAMKTRPAAVRRGVQRLIKPPWWSGGFSYAHIVQPVLDKHCIKCHHAPYPPKGLDLSGDKTDFFNVSYEHLARKGHGPGTNPYTSWIPTFNGMEANILEISPESWGSPASKLADIIMKGHPDKAGNSRVNLADEEKRSIFAWIDLNVPYYGTSESNHLSRTGCRQMIPDNFEEMFSEISSRRCIGCHKNGPPRENYIRITNPRFNSFLLAPLDKKAGGKQKCSKPVFESINDPDYQAVLRAFDDLNKFLEDNPRKDMTDIYSSDHTVNGGKSRGSGYTVIQ